MSAEKYKRARSRLLAKENPTAEDFGKLFFIEYMAFGGTLYSKNIFSQAVDKMPQEERKRAVASLLMVDGFRESSAYALRASSVVQADTAMVMYELKSLEYLYKEIKTFDESAAYEKLKNVGLRKHSAPYEPGRFPFNGYMFSTIRSIKSAKFYAECFNASVDAIAKWLKLPDLKSKKIAGMSERIAKINSEVEALRETVENCHLPYTTKFVTIETINKVYHVIEDVKAPRAFKVRLGKILRDDLELLERKNFRLDYAAYTAEERLQIDGKFNNYPEE